MKCRVPTLYLTECSAVQCSAVGLSRALLMGPGLNLITVNLAVGGARLVPVHCTVLHFRAVY